MDDVLLNYGLDLRFAIFFAILILMTFWEIMSPKRRQEIPRVLRWANNLAMIALDTLILRLAFPILAVGMAQTAQAYGWGLFNVFKVPYWVAVLLTILVLDLVIYIQHVVFHAVPTLWRLHRMHHSDLEIDVTTGLRFHPVEIVISMIIKLVAVSALGPPASAVLLFEILLNGTAMFNHSNIHLPPKVDRILRWITVTPDMHRIHHSVDPVETNSNYGFNLTLWDYFFGTYRAKPAKGHQGMEIGIEQFRDPREQWLDRMLTQPLRGPATGHALDPKQTARPNQSGE